MHLQTSKYLMIVSVLWAATVFADQPKVSAPHATAQLDLPRIELMPNEPPGFKLLDFAQTARGFDQVAFQPAGKLMWWDDSHVNIPGRGIGMPSYVDHPEMKSGSNHEAITVLGAILGSTLAGIDKRAGENNFAAMSAQYFNSANGLNVVLNRESTKTGNSYWYELFPQILFDSIAVRYPQEQRLTEISDIAARRWLEAFDALAKNGKPSFEHIAFDLATMKPVETGKQHEPDAAAGFAHIFYTSFLRTRDERFLNAANVCLKTIEDREASPSYEILMPFGAYAAARINAECGGEHDVGGLLNDFLEPRSDVRAGWGLIVGNWNGVEVSGMLGSVNDAGGYGFVMNTYAAAMGIVPIARYDERYARSIAKWALNAAGAVRYCYPGQLPEANTTRPGFVSNPPNVIAFEGIRHRYKGISPLAGGDPTVYGWGPCDLGLYGSGFAGVYGGIIRPTTDPLILQLDLLAADPSPPTALPTHLYFNPHSESKTIQLDLGSDSVDLYDSIRNRLIATGAHGRFDLAIAANEIAMIVRIPAGSKIEIDGRRSHVGEIVIDYENGMLPPRPAPMQKFVDSKARRLLVPKFTPTLDGDAKEWTGHGSRPLALDTSGRGELRANLSFAWDDEYLYTLIQETHRGKDVHEAADALQLGNTPWDFDTVNFYIDLGNGKRASLGDFVWQLGFGSDGQRDLAFSSQAPDDGTANLQSVCSGKATSGDRRIEARVAWKGIAAAAFGQGSPYRAEPGLTIGCEPMLAEMNHTRQSFLGGSQYQRPTGIDANSIDLVLQSVGD